MKNYLKNIIEARFQKSRLLRRRISASRMCREDSGSSAAEFALIAPILLIFIMGMMEVTQAFIVDQRIKKFTYSVSDLVAQTDKLSNAQLNDIYVLGATILAPYSAETLALTVSYVEADDKNKTKVHWSYEKNGGKKPTICSNYSLPKELTHPFSGVVVADVSYTHRSLFSRYIVGDLELTSTHYSRPRKFFVENTDVTKKCT